MKPNFRSILLRWTSFMVLAVGIGTGMIATEPSAQADMNDQVALLDIDNDHLEDVIRIFGQPQQYIWGEEVFDPGDIPVDFYVAVYPNQFSVFMRLDWIMELRFESAASGFIFENLIQVGSSLNAVLSVVGQPTRTVVGGANAGEDGVLYKDINGQTGWCYYRRSDHNVRFYFGEYNVSAIYVTRSDFDTFTPPLTSIEPYDDVRWKDLSQFDLSDRPNLPATLWFNEDTIWPEAAMMPPNCNPSQILNAAKNPGLGVQQLHQQGITGTGVNIAIIDFAMFLTHPEYAGKIVAYRNLGSEISSMHGPAVASLAVGRYCGTAPDARVYYVAVPSDTYDASNHAQALQQIMEWNAALPSGNKIRVVSISAAPGNEPWFNRDQYLGAVSLAEQSGIMVIDVTRFVGTCWYDASDPESCAACTPGFPGIAPYFDPARILVPSSPRTQAEVYQEGEFSYQYTGRGGSSWTIPYCAGVLAMGWQIRPNLSAEQMQNFLFETAHTQSSGAKIIDPQAFIQRLSQPDPGSILDLH